MKRNNEQSLAEVLCFVLVMALPFLSWGCFRIWNYVEFTRDCGSYMAVAANANTVELAKDKLETVIKYMEDNRLKSGYTSLFVNTEDENVSFWYSNMKATVDELSKVAPETSQMERSNILLKLRETLLDKGEKGERLAVPEGITIYPNNWLYFIWLAGSVLWMIVLGIWGACKLE